MNNDTMSVIEPLIRAKGVSQICLIMQTLKIRQPDYPALDKAVLYKILLGRENRRLSVPQLDAICDILELEVVIRPKEV